MNLYKTVTILCCIPIFSGASALALSEIALAQAELTGANPQSFSFPELQKDASTGDWWLEIRDDANGWIYKFTLPPDRYGRGEVQQFDSNGLLLVEYLLEVSGVGDPRTGEAVLEMKFMDMNGNTVQTFALEVAVSNPVVTQAGEVLGADVAYVLDDLQPGSDGRYLGQIDTAAKTLTAVPSQLSGLVPLGALKIESGQPREFYFVFTTPHVAAGVAIVGILWWTVAGTIESLDGDYDCSSWLSWFWDGCWW